MPKFTPPPHRFYQDRQEFNTHKKEIATISEHCYTEIFDLKKKSREQRLFMIHLKNEPFVRAQK